MAEAKEQVAKGTGDEMEVISDGVANSNSQTAETKQLHQSDLLKLNQETEKLKKFFR